MTRRFEGDKLLVATHNAGKLEEMREKLAKKLADPTLYEDSRLGELETWNKKYAEVMDGLHKAEGLWEKAIEKLDTAESAA